MSAIARFIATASLLQDPALKPWVIENTNKQGFHINRKVLRVAASIQLQANCKFNRNNFINELKALDRG